MATSSLVVELTTVDASRPMEENGKMRDVYVVCVGMTGFSKFLETGMKQLALEA